MADIDTCNGDTSDSVVSNKIKTEDDKAEMSFSSSIAIISKLNALKNNVSGGGHDKPAELFRKDLISAMKLPDSESLHRDDYYLISDHWRQDWEKGVQVPVNPTALKINNVKIIKENEVLNGPYLFKLPKKLLHAVQDETYRQGMHELHETQKLADEVCRYDLDELDITWLANYNNLRQQHGDLPLIEYDMERVLEQLETHCYDGMQEAMKTVEGLGIEYDEDVICDICRSPECEDGNEMIFCDSCDVCVHQACYGVQKIPTGSWLCRPCALGIKPRCVLCPNMGGAMKSTIDGLRWAHLSCALWIPEIVIGDTVKMEPISKISDIPANRWSLICTLCRERTGACIQCCVPKCKTAFHVTCAFENNLDMKNNFDEDTELVLKGYCKKHTKNHDGADGSPHKTPTSTPKKHAPMTEEEKKAAKKRKIEKLAEEFYTYVGDLKPIAEKLELDVDTVDVIFSYWVLKRKCHFNKPLMTPKVEEGDLLLRQEEDSMIARLKMFIHLRQDLERVRNLCYMVTKREKMRNQLLEAKRQLFVQQTAILRSQNGRKLSSRDYSSIAVAHRQSTSVYDFPDKVIRIAKIAEAAAAAKDCDETLSESFCAPPVETAKSPKHIKGRGRGRPPASANAGPGNSAPKKTPASTENPYARPTYRSFEWIKSSRRRSAPANTSTPVPDSSKSPVKRKRRRELFSNNVAGAEGETPAVECSHVDVVTVTDIEKADANGNVNITLTACDHSPNTVTECLDVIDVTDPVCSTPCVEKTPTDDTVNSSVPVDDCDKLQTELLRPSDAEPASEDIAASSDNTCDRLLEPVTEELTEVPNKSPSTDRQSSPRTDVLKLQTRHFSDILLSHMTSDAKSEDHSCSNTASVNGIDDKIDVVSDVTNSSDISVLSTQDSAPVRNGCVRQRHRLSLRGRMHASCGDRLVNGFRQKTLDGFLLRLKNGMPSEHDSGLENVERDSTENTPDASLLPACRSAKGSDKRPYAKRAKRELFDDRDSCSDFSTDVDSYIDVDSVDDAWRRRSSLRSSSAIVNTR